nr:MAG TPA: hypothetical protein [Caudoviricetes sp.]
MQPVRDTGFANSARVCVRLGQRLRFEGYEGIPTPPLDGARPGPGALRLVLSLQKAG